MVVTACRERVPTACRELLAGNYFYACFHMAMTVVTLSLVNFLPRDRIQAGGIGKFKTDTVPQRGPLPLPPLIVPKPEPRCRFIVSFKKSPSRHVDKLYR
jgi:hypothetical protein